MNPPMSQEARADTRPASDPADPFDHAIARLYRSVLSVPPRDFRAWALDSLQSLIPHDGALWGTGLWDARRFHSVTLRGVPDDYPRRLESTVEDNPIIRQMVVSPDEPMCMEDVFPDAQFFNSRLYRDAFEPAGIARILATVHVDRRSGLCSLVSLYRKNRDAPFSDAERRLQKRVNFHLFNAASHSFFIHLARTHRERPARAAAAVVDSRGIFHEVLRWTRRLTFLTSSFGKIV